VDTYLLGRLLTSERPFPRVAPVASTRSTATAGQCVVISATLDDGTAPSVTLGYK
jgi:hypothetical protein